MARKLSLAIATAMLLSAAAVNAKDVPSSANETGPVTADHARGAADTRGASAAGSYRNMETQDARSYEVQTPSSVSESAPWLTGQQHMQYGKRMR